MSTSFRSCEICVWWTEDEALNRGFKLRHGLCRGGPPTTYTNEPRAILPTGRGQWPVTPENEYCRNFDPEFPPIVYPSQSTG